MRQNWNNYFFVSGYCINKRIWTTASNRSCSLSSENATNFPALRIHVRIFEKWSRGRDDLLFLLTHWIRWTGLVAPAVWQVERFSAFSRTEWQIAWLKYVFLRILERSRVLMQVIHQSLHLHLNAVVWRLENKEIRQPSKPVAHISFARRT